MENSVCKKDISSKLFDFLCDVIGSAKVVKVRRLFFKITEDVVSNSESPIIISGSKAEGLNMKGSDNDFMFVFTELPVYNCKSQIDNKFGLITDTENAAPGFVLLTLPRGNIPYHLFQNAYSENGLLLLSTEFKQIMLKIMNNGTCFKWLHIHGPCVSSFDEVFDFAICLKSDTWPFICTKWFCRPRYLNWPTLNDVEQISKEGLLYVPIGSKFGSKKENSLEWRMSFSIPEKILVHSFNQTQLICYALLKIVLKEVINTRHHFKDLLCSYFMKTVVFWLAEESDASTWKPKTLFTCFQSCLDRLIYWVRIGYCPNYFMPENNMFEGKIVGACQSNLLDMLTILRNEGVGLIYRSTTLSKFLSCDDFRYNTLDSEAEDKAIYPLLNNYMILRHSQKYYKILRRLSGDLVNRGQLTKSLFLIWLMISYCAKVEKIPYKFYASNKPLYRCYKLLLSYCLIAKNINVVYGGALLATFFYRHKEYEKSLSVTSYALQECTPDKYYVHRFSSLNLEGRNIKNSNISFLQRYKLSCIYGYFILPSQQSVLRIQEFKEFNPCDEIVAPPNIFIHYIRFMCFHHLENFVERNRCLVDIKLAIEEGFLINKFSYLDRGLFYFMKAAKVANSFAYFHEASKLWMDICREMPTLFSADE